MCVDPQNKKQNIWFFVSYWTKFESCNKF